MSKKYDDYLDQHILNVHKAMDWFFDHGLIDENLITRESANLQAMKHDKSKFLRREYDAYDDYFYGKDGKSEVEKKLIDQAFDYAWLHHIHNNPHHWQYWVLVEDEGNMVPLEMPEEYVYEMIADWWSFSWKENKLDEIFKWYDDHEEKIVMHEKTRKLVEDILERIREELDKEADGG